MTKSSKSIHKLGEKTLTSGDCGASCMSRDKFMKQHHRALEKISSCECANEPSDS